MRIQTVSAKTLVVVGFKKKVSVATICSTSCKFDQKSPRLIFFPDEGETFFETGGGKVGEESRIGEKKSVCARVIGKSVLAEVGNYLKHSRGRHTETDAVVASANKKVRKGGEKAGTVRLIVKEFPLQSEAWSDFDRGRASLKMIFECNES